MELCTSTVNSDLSTEEPQRKRPRLSESSQNDSMAAASKTRVILTLCGSMSPITNLHLRMFELARDHLNHSGRYLVNKGIISAVHDSYGKKGLASSKHRKAMVELALSGSSWIKLDTWEIEQRDWTPTKQVIQHLQEVASKESNGQDKIMLLCGADLLESFGTPGVWHDDDIKTIVGEFGLAVISRFGHNAEEFIYKSDQLFPLRNNIQIVTEWIPNDVSSTKIRRSIRRGESVKYLIPDPVIHYIKEHVCVLSLLQSLQEPDT